MLWNSQRAGGAGPSPPSLNALWAFEAAARHASFTRAAAELSVTQTAVSHQIRRLEQELGCALFRRGPRVTLTREGEAWARELSPLFSRLREVNQRLRQARPPERELVSVSVIPSFGSRWLMPRLGGFIELHPDVDVRISATERLVDLELEPVDVAIRYGSGRYPGLSVDKLAPDAFVPVASPSLLAASTPADPQALSRLPLLHDDHPRGWADWFAVAGHALAEPTRLTELTESAMLVEAALRGQGVALTRISLVSEDLNSGRLVRLFPELPPLPTDMAYYVVCKRGALARAVVASFRDWLLNEAKALRQPVT
jgi:LysR family glycine cleavage system transcriptional activator